ncbi:MAG: YtxH domain-containing protein [Caulobacteraceae bacterium]
MMRRGSRNMMAWGALGALAGMALIPAMNSRTRKKVARSARNAYFRASDLLQDMKDMGHK